MSKKDQVIRNLGRKNTSKMSNILIIDDVKSVRDNIKIVLEADGFKVSKAKNADDAWKKIKKNKPDLILLDVLMPGMRPIDFIKKINGSPKLKSIKIIYVTVVKGVKEAVKWQKGVVATIEKPFKNKKLIAEVKKALKFDLKYYKIKKY